MDFEPESYLNTQAQPGLSMPFNLDAEQSVLGAVLLDAECLSLVAEILPRAEYFYAVNNRLIYGAMLEMFTLGQPVDFVTVLERLREEQDFDQEQGRVYMIQLAQLVPSVRGAETYANIVREKYELRALMQSLREILDEAGEVTDASRLLDLSLIHI